MKKFCIFTTIFFVFSIMSPAISGGCDWCDEIDENEDKGARSEQTWGYSPDWYSDFGVLTNLDGWQNILIEGWGTGTGSVEAYLGQILDITRRYENGDWLAEHVFQAKMEAALYGTESPECDLWGELSQWLNGSIDTFAEVLDGNIFTAGLMDMNAGFNVWGTGETIGFGADMDAFSAYLHRFGSPGSNTFIEQIGTINLDYEAGEFPSPPDP